MISKHKGFAKFQRKLDGGSELKPFPTIRDEDSFSSAFDIAVSRLQDERWGKRATFFCSFLSSLVIKGCKYEELIGEALRTEMVTKPLLEAIIEIGQYYGYGDT